MNKLETNFNLDIVLAILYLIIMEPKLTGLALHEWVGLGLGIIFIIHIVLHWQWILEASKRYFKKFPKKAKLNYALDIILLIGSFVILLSGLPISRKIGFSWLSIGGNINMWQHIHVAAAFLTLLVIAIHIGLHWKWAINAFKKVGQYEIKSVSIPLKGVFMITVVLFGLYSLNYTEYFNTIKNNLIFDNQYVSQSQNNTSLSNNLYPSSNVASLSEGEKSKGGRGGGGGRGSGSGYPSYTVTTDSSSIAAYFGISIFVIMLVYYIEIYVNKIFRKRKKILLN